MLKSFLIFIFTLSIFDQSWDETYKSLTKTANNFFGETRLFFLGAYPEKDLVATFGHGEISNDLRITAINGILNQKQDWEQFSTILSETHGNVNVHSLYWPSGGWTADLQKCAVANTGVLTTSAKRLAILWRQMIEEMGGIHSNGTVIHYAHSIGSLETFIARTLMTKEELKKIKVITFGAPHIYNNEDFLEVTHYVSYFDGVCMLNPVSYFNLIHYPQSHVIFINETYQGPPLLDHFIAYGSYRDQLDIIGAEFIAQHGYLD